MKHLLYILLIGSLFSCVGTSETHYPRYTDFPHEKALKAEIVDLDTALFRYPFRIAVGDSIAVVMDLHNAENYFHAFTLPEWKHLVSFGKRGEAPSEMLSAETFRFDGACNSLWALDANRMQLTHWTISIDSCSAKREKEINLDKNLVRALDFYAMESGFLIPDYLGEHRFNRVGSAGEYLQSEGTIPTEEEYKEMSLPALAQAWRSFIDYNPANGILVLATQLGEVLEIYDLNNNSHTVLYGPCGEPQFQIAEGEGIPVGIMGFSDVQVTDKYIYAVFHGRTFKEIQASHQKGGKPEDGGRYIYVFDLKGNPVRKYTLDRAVYGIDVDEAAGTILATDVNSDEPIVRYKI